MATLYVTEFSGGSPQSPVVATPKLTSNNVAIGAASAQSSAFSGNTSLIRVSPDVTCSVEIGGQNPVATATSQRMAGDSVEYFYVRPGDKLAVITNT